MTTELSTTLATQINTTHSECCGADGAIRDAVLTKANKARECGLFLIEAKEQCGHGKWEAWARSNLSFSLETAALYVRFSKANPNPITELQQGVDSLKDALITSGALSAPSRATIQQRSPLTFVSRITGEVMELMGMLNAKAEKEPVDQWPDEDRQAVKAQLEPAVRFHAML